MRLGLINPVGLRLILLEIKRNRLSICSFILHMRPRMLWELAVYMVHGLQRRTHHLITVHGLRLIGLLPVLIVHFIGIDELRPRSHDHP